MRANDIWNIKLDVNITDQGCKIQHLSKCNHNVVITLINSNFLNFRNLYLIIKLYIWLFINNLEKIFTSQNAYHNFNNCNQECSSSLLLQFYFYYSYVVKMFVALGGLLYEHLLLQYVIPVCFLKGFMDSNVKTLPVT